MAKEKLSPMQQEILQRADSIFQSLSETAARAADFAGEQIPDIAMQYVAFGRAYETFWVATAAIIAMLSIIGLAKNWRKTGSYSDDHFQAFVICLISGLGLLMPTTLLLTEHLKSFLLVWFAPKMWLILEITRLVKG